MIPSPAGHGDAAASLSIGEVDVVDVVGVLPEVPVAGDVEVVPLFWSWLIVLRGPGGV